MPTTLNTAAVAVMTELGENTGNATLVSQYEAWVQRGYEEVARHQRWNWLRQEEDLATVASTATYDIDINAFAITAARIQPDDDPLTYMPKEEMIQRGFNIEETGRPRFWYFNGFTQATGKNNIGLWPIPDAIYTVELVQRGQALQLATGDNIPVPEEFISVIQSAAKALSLANEKDWDGYDREAQYYRSELRKLGLRYAHTPGQVRTFEPTDVPDLSRAPLVRFPPSQFSN